MLVWIQVALFAAEAAGSGGLTVTGQRHAERVAETPQSMEVADRKQIDDAGHLDLSEWFATLP